jgi:hypothetical protein
MANKTILVAGASGVNGYAVTNHFLKQTDFDVNKALRAGFNRMNRSSSESIINYLKMMEKMRLIPNNFYLCRKNNDNEKITSPSLLL